MEDEFYSDESPQARAIELGMNSLSAREALTLLLDNVPGRDADTLAGLLLKKWDTVADLQRASLRDLKDVGVDTITALRIKAGLLLGRRANVGAITQGMQVKTPDVVAQAYMSEMVALEVEEIHVVCLNTRNLVLGKFMVYRGTLNSVNIRIADLFVPAVRTRAAAIIMIHNHPSGSESPSPDDVAVTREVIKAGKNLNIDVLDHLVIGHNGYTSLKERGMAFE